MEPGADGEAIDPNEEELDEHVELDDLDPDEFPRIYNAERLDQAEMGIGQVLAMRFSGDGVSRRGASLRLAGELFTELHKYFTGAQPVAAGLEVALSGAPPRLPGVEAPLLQGAFSGHSITIVLGLAGVEASLLSKAGDSERRKLVEQVAAFPTGHDKPTPERAADQELAAKFPTVTAAHWLTEMLAENPEKAVEHVQQLGRRATRDFLNITELMANNKLDTHVRSHDRSAVVEVPSGRAWATVETLRKTAHESTSTFSIVGALYQADAKNDRFRLISDDGSVYSGTYVAGMTALIRDAWAKMVRATLVRIEFRWVGTDRPHRVVYELQSIDRVLGDADQLLKPKSD